MHARELKVLENVIVATIFSCWHITRTGWFDDQLHCNELESSYSSVSGSFRFFDFYFYLQIVLDPLPRQPVFELIGIMSLSDT